MSTVPFPRTPGGEPVGALLPFIWEARRRHPELSVAEAAALFGARHPDAVAWAMSCCPAYPDLLPQ